MGEFLIQFFTTPEKTLWGNSPGDWLIAAIVAAAVWITLWILRDFIARRYRRYLAGVNSPPVRILPDLAGSTRQFFMVAIALFVARAYLVLPPAVQRALFRLVLVLILLQAGIWAVRSVRLLLDIKRQERGADATLTGSMSVILLVSRLLIWSVLMLVALENFGVNITALLAGLGVGGVAVALALQNVLGDLFASLSIALDKPLIVGDFLTIDAFSGTVERIGVKTTRLRSESGEQIILSNADILKSRVRNYGRAAELRVLSTVRVRYDTPVEKLRAIPQLLEGIVRNQNSIRFERCHLTVLGQWSLQFELSYFRVHPAGNSVLDLQHEVNCRIIEEFRQAGIQFALPVNPAPAAASA
ncbi:MAG: mechanosensitive ion channel family protein [Steroidobacterales bacterium]